jgi:hypothetical protein
MTGWKTKAGAALLIVFGILGAFFGLHDLTEGVRLVGEGLIAIGVGHKIQKAGDVYAQTKAESAADLVRRYSEH